MISSSTSDRATPGDELLRAAALVERWSGIALPAERLWVLESELRRLSPDGSLAAGLAAIEWGDAAVRSRLLASVTIGETYFFRHHGHFEILARLAEERLLDSRPIRVLSAGCATGEEAWSAAATILAAAGHAGRSDRLRVEGWDLDPRRIEIARRGSYSAWSVRRGLFGYDRFFDQHAGRWTVGPALRPLVRFRHLNLVGDPFPADARFDVIFFRNVSIYWRSEVTRHVFEKLAALLEEDGVVFVGPSDPVKVAPPWLDRLEASQRVLSRAAKGRTPLAMSPPPPAATATSSPRPRTHEVPSRASSAGRPPPPVPEPARHPDDGWRDAVLSLADAGEYALALEVLTARADPASSEAKYLEGVLLLNLGRAAEAAARLREAVFFEPDNHLYRRWLAIVLEASGQTREAKREYGILDMPRR